MATFVMKEWRPASGFSPFMLPLKGSPDTAQCSIFFDAIYFYLHLPNFPYYQSNFIILSLYEHRVSVLTGEDQSFLKARCRAWTMYQAPMTSKLNFSQVAAPLA